MGDINYGRNVFLGLASVTFCILIKYIYLGYSLLSDIPESEKLVLYIFFSSGCFNMLNVLFELVKEHITFRRQVNDGN